MLELIKTLCALPGPSGCEDAVRDFIRAQAEPYADKIETDPMGNLFVYRAGKKHLPKPVMLCAHMDEVGLIVKKITEDGMLKFGFVGGVDPRVVIGRAVRLPFLSGRPSGKTCSSFPCPSSSRAKETLTSTQPGFSSSPRSASAS